MSSSNQPGPGLAIVSAKPSQGECFQATEYSCALGHDPGRWQGDRDRHRVAELQTKFSDTADHIGDNGIVPQMAIGGHGVALND